MTVKSPYESFVAPSIPDYWYLAQQFLKDPDGQLVITDLPASLTPENREDLICDISASLGSHGEDSFPADYELGVPNDDSVIIYRRVT